MTADHDFPPVGEIGSPTPFRIVSIEGRIGRPRMIADPIGLGFFIMLSLVIPASIGAPESVVVIAGTAIVGLVYPTLS